MVFEQKKMYYFHHMYISILFFPHYKCIQVNRLNEYGDWETFGTHVIIIITYYYIVYTRTNSPAGPGRTLFNVYSSRIVWPIKKKKKIEIPRKLLADDREKSF